jgi:lipopolysaccharide/colanic/teichoic acid biosynthesis glycosyltransferase
MYSAADLIAKRAFDVAAAAGGLFALSPVLIATALLVKLSSPGPVLFRQERVGRHGRTFELIKFRSMRVGVDGPLITSGTDGRITRVGKIIRRTKLDELPQLFNVIRGDLSLVGPRPEVARYVALYSDVDRQFLQRVRPGITDPATIQYRNEEQILARSSDPERTYQHEVLPAKVRLCRSYLEEASFVKDLGVLARTLQVIVRPLRASTSMWSAAHESD